MRNMHINRQKCYIANRLNGEVDDYGNALFDQPFLFNENLANVDGESEIAEWGERVNKMYKSVVQRVLWEGKISEGDNAYLEGIVPPESDTRGLKANYKVESVRYPSLNTMAVYFEKKE